VSGRDGPGVPETPPPLSVKGVCLDECGRVLVCRNWRRGWELPGGRPGLGEALEAGLVPKIRVAGSVGVLDLDHLSIQIQTTVRGQPCQSVSGGPGGETTSRPVGRICASSSSCQ